jgi:arabinofuranosyltransferase
MIAPSTTTDRQEPGAGNSRCLFWPVLSLVLVSVVLAQAWLKFYSYQDDAFIFFRYADNVLRGNGLVFNPGERVEGFSSPLWLALLIGCGALGLDPLHAAGILGSVASVATVLLSVRDARQCWFPGSWLAPVALALFFPFVAWSVSGMETSLFTALVWGTMSGIRVARARSRPLGRDVALCLAGAVLTRPEAAMLIVALLVDELASARGQIHSLRSAIDRFRWLIPAILAGLCLEAFRLAYYGDLVPNTAYAKLGISGAHVRLGLRYILGFVAASPMLWPALLLPVLRRPVPGAAATVVLALLWSLDLLVVGGDHFGYFRFLVPLAPLLFALGAQGLDALWSRLSGSIGPHRRALLGLGLGVAILAAVVRAAPDPAPGRPQHGFDWTLASAKLGQRMAAALPPSTLVALPHIGAFGYYSRLPVLDLLGLVDRQLARRPSRMPPAGPTHFNDIGHERFDIEWSLARRPALIVPSRSYGSRPFTDLSELRPDFEAEAQLFRIVAQRADYRLTDVPLDDGAHWGVFLRSDLDEGLLTGLSPSLPR